MESASLLATSYMNNVVLIIQARMGSKRLPGKSMFYLAGEPLVGRILERVARCKLVTRIVLAIPDTSENDCLDYLGRAYKVSVFRGSESNLLDRYLKAAEWCKADIVVRLPADNPTPEPTEIDKIIQFHVESNRNGFSTNLAQIHNSGYPDGIGAEVFTIESLRKVASDNPSPDQCEHIHLNFLDYSQDSSISQSLFPVKTISCPVEYARPDIVLDVNTMEQYLYMKNLYESIYPLNKLFSIRDIVEWHDRLFKRK